MRSPGGALPQQLAPGPAAGAAGRLAAAWRSGRQERGSATGPHRDGAGALRREPNQAHAPRETSPMTHQRAELSAEDRATAEAKLRQALELVRQTRELVEPSADRKTIENLLTVEAAIADSLYSFG